MSTVSDSRHNPPRAAHVAPVFTGPGRRARSGTIEGRLDGSHITRVASNEIPTAEGLIAVASRVRSHDTIHEDEEGTHSSKFDDEQPAALAKDENGHAVDTSTYPDGGWKAWGVVLGSFILMCCQMGYGSVWGVFMTELHATKFKETPLSILTLIVGTSNVWNQSYDWSGHHYSAMALYMSLPTQWFKKRRGLATGVTASGTGFGGAISSLIIRALLPKLGFSHTLLVYASLNLVVSIGAWFLLATRGEQPKKSDAGGKRQVAASWLPAGVWKDPAFISLMSSLFFGPYGFLIPMYYITAYTNQVCPTLTGLLPAVPLVCMSLGMGVGRVLAGMIADKVGPVNCYFASFFVGGLLQILVWPHATSFGVIIVFSVLFGAIGTAFMSLLPMVAAQLWGIKDVAQVTGAGVMINAPAQFVGGTIGGLILTNAGGGHDYRPVMYYSGSMMVFGSVCILVARFSRVPRIFARF
ncbi:hypothetical protein MNV49_006750 [Pseudohyphozyma bogoriensis]|nr:hypothetical protein MNV49_006750 [Pseudohyphozyma bogoriensis]